MTKTAWIITVIVAAVAAVGIWIWTRPKPPASLAAAILANKDQFPSPQVVLLPPSSQSRLGRRAESLVDVTTAAGRRVTLEASPCFFIVPKTAKGLDELTIKYSDAREANAELGFVAGASLSASSSDNLVMTLTELKIRDGVGVPNLNGICKFTQSAAFQVVTSETVASTVTVTADRALSVGAGTSVPTAGASIDGKAGWSSTQSGQLKGQNIVLSGSFSTLNVDVASERHDLGTRPLRGQAFPIPGLSQTSLIVEAFDASSDTLTILVNVPANEQPDQPADLQACKTATSQMLHVGSRCSFWIGSGNALAAAEWSYIKENGRTRVVLDVHSYRTTVTQAPAPPKQTPGRP